MAVATISPARRFPKKSTKMKMTISAPSKRFFSTVWSYRSKAMPPPKKKSEGFYAVVDMTTTPEIAQELDRQLGLNETVLRTKLLRPEA